jgi:hypothetical protein
MSRAPRLARNIAISATSVLLVLLGGFVVLFAFALLTTVVPFGSAYVWANIGVIVSLAVVVLTLVVAIEVVARRWGKRVARTASIPVVAGLLVVGIVLTQKPPPPVQPFTAFFLRQAPHDVLLLVDPNDPTVRGLINGVRSSPKEWEPTEVGTWGTNVRIGVAVLRPPGIGAPWRLVHPPTSDYGDLFVALGSIEPNPGGRATRSIGPALSQLAPRRGGGLPWSKRRPHTIVLVVGKLPTEAELVGRTGFTADDWDRTLDVIARSATGGLKRSGLSVIWDPTVAQTAQAEKRWRTWAWTARGNAGEPEMGFFDFAAFASLNRYFKQDRELALTYRPHLLFDSEERFRPKDVTRFLAEEQPNLCEPEQLRRDDCPSKRVEGLIKELVVRQGGEYNENDPSYVLYRLHLANKKSYFELGGDERTGRDLEPDDRGSLERKGSLGKIYYRVTRHGDRAYIEYWWFFRFNESPVYADYMCLAGLSIASGSCFDHQGDWEGITVSVPDKEDAKPEEALVTYTGHHWPGYTYKWPDLVGLGSVADGTHPRVYVANGSHASYPTPCDADCTQLDYRIKIGRWKFKWELEVPDGAHDGTKPWPPNARGSNENCACLEPLPVDFSGRPAHWLKYQGKWGSAACTYILKACTRTLGPHSPAYQGRYGSPFKFEMGSLEMLKRSG